MPNFLLDENVNFPDTIVERCAEVDIVVLRVHEVGLEQTVDEDIFEFAMANGYIVVTGNVRHFRPMQLAWLAAGLDFPGVLYLSPNAYRNVGAIISKIIEIERDYQPGGEWWVAQGQDR